MAVLTKTTNVLVSNEIEKRHALEVINNTSTPPKSVLDKLSNAMKVNVKEEFF